MTDGTIFVVKRDGSKEELDLDKIHMMVEAAAQDLPGVSASQVEINSGIQFFDGIKTSEIQSILVKSAADLISTETPNYQYLASRLLLFGVRKEVFERVEPLTLQEIIDKNVKAGTYDPEILNMYTSKELDKLGGYIKHDRDYMFTYAGLRQMVDKYLIQDRLSGKVFETPQYMYMMIAATLFAKYPTTTRMTYVKKYYDAISTFKISLPTPIMSGVRHPKKQYASCSLFDVDDTLNSIFNQNTAIGLYTADRAGVGINMGRIRGINSRIRGGDVVHTGVIPFLKMFVAATRSCTQNGVRGGNSTVHFPIWHREIEDIIVLKNNKGTEDNRERRCDYSIQLRKLFYQRYMRDENITLFSSNDVPGLYVSFFGGTDEEFEALYTKFEKDDSIPNKKTVSARTLFNDLLKERAETGRIYLFNADHVNTHSSFTDLIYMSNLCQEITLPTTPIQSLMDESGEIALCVLSALNLGKITELSEIEVLADLIVRSLDALIDHQSYPVRAAEISTKARRSLGIGYIGLAHYLAKNKLKYSDPEAWKLVEKTTEAFQYYLLKASNNLAKEQGPCDWFHRTKYAKGILPIDTYKREVDEIYSGPYQYDWEGLRNDIKVHGLRNSTLTAQMPAESSAVVSNATNGIEAPRDFISVKKSKKGTLRQLVPQYPHLKKHYTLLWDDPKFMDGYIRIVAVMQKYFDQSISSNWSYNPEHYPNNEVPMSVIVKHLFDTYKYGHKTTYYQNTYDSKTEDDIVDNKRAAEEIIEISVDEEECESCHI